MLMQWFVNMAVKKASPIWGAEENEFSIESIARHEYTMHYIDGWKHWNTDIGDTSTYS